VYRRSDGRRVALNGQRIIHFSVIGGIGIISQGQGFFVHRRIISVVRRVEFISDGMLCIVLRGCWCSIIVLNMHVPCKDKSDDVKDSFCEKLRCAFGQFPRYDMKILLDDFSAKVGSENIFKLTIGNEGLHKINDVSGVRVVKFSTSKKLLVKTYNVASLQYS
jgi:hypothetical protein